jgi:cell wall-associated NlpC family hydrolase
MNTGSIWRLLGVAIPPLALVGALASAPAAGASATPTSINATSTHLCAGSASWCPDVIASVPVNAQLQVICSRVNSYYIEDLANRALEGFVAKSDVRNAPGGLGDCDTTAHPAIYAAANALGWMGQEYDPSTGPFNCLQFVAAAWAGAGKPIPGDDDAIDWWNSYSKDYPRELSNQPRYGTPPRGALVFWAGTDSYPQDDSEDGHVAISVGNGWVVSTEQGNSGPDVHLVSISAVTKGGGGTYLGWIMPIPGYQIQQ